MRSTASKIVLSNKKPPDLTAGGLLCVTDFARSVYVVQCSWSIPRRDPFDHLPVLADGPATGGDRYHVQQPAAHLKGRGATGR